MNGSQAKPPECRPWWRRGLRLLAVYVAVPYLAIVLLLSLFQRCLIYRPVRDATLSAKLPAFRGARARAISFAAADDLKVHGWHVAPDQPAPKTPPNDRPVVLFFCGNGGHRAWRCEEFQIFAELGAEAVCFDYRGYGETDGAPSEDAFAADAHAAWRFVTGDLKIEPGRIVIFGESLGGGVATRLASELSARGTPPAGLVLRSTFTSLTDTAAWHFPWIPVRSLLVDRYPSIERIAHVTCPILILHGRNDSIVPFVQGERLFAVAPAKSAAGIPKRFIALERADHNDVLLSEESTFRTELECFLGRINPRIVHRQMPEIQRMLAELVRRRTYFPDRVDDLAPGRLRLPPDRVHAVTLRTHDGCTLKGWHFLAGGCHAADLAACDRALAAGRPLVLFFSGNGGNRAYRVAEARVLTQAGADVFLFDYRGYGDNSGTPSEAGLAADAQAVWRYATQERRVEPQRIVLYGESLGGAVAIRLASEVCQAGTPPAGLIVRSTFSSLIDAARHLFPLLPVNMLLHERYASTEWIGKVTCPILMLHGVRDLVVPHQLGRKLLDAAPRRSADGTPIEFVDLPHSDHNDVLEADGALLQETVDAFIGRVAPHVAAAP